MRVQHREKSQNKQPEMQVIRALPQVLEEFLVEVLGEV